MLESTDVPTSDPEKHGETMAMSRRWKLFGSSKAASTLPAQPDAWSESNMGIEARPQKWSLGVLNDKETDEVPGELTVANVARGHRKSFTNLLMLGSVLLMSNTKRNEPLGLRNVPARTSASSLPLPYPSDSRSATPRRASGGHVIADDKKKTKDGTMILEPQPDDSMNDPLNWPALRRDVALLSLGFYCMLGGGMTPVLAAGFNDVAETYRVSVPQVALTTGLYMMGLGLGCVVTSPTAILFGKRPVYLVCIILFVLSSIWCAASPSYASLVVGRIFMGFAVSPVECLPSATIAEIFFLHERAYRTPHRPAKGRHSSRKAFSSLFHQPQHDTKCENSTASDTTSAAGKNDLTQPAPTSHTVTLSIAERRQHKKSQHVGFADYPAAQVQGPESRDGEDTHQNEYPPRLNLIGAEASGGDVEKHRKLTPYPGPLNASTPETDHEETSMHLQESLSAESQLGATLTVPVTADLNEKSPGGGPQRYTTYLRTQPPKTFMQTLRPWNGQLRHENWFKVALRPFILFAYPAILWSALVYSLSIGWLIVLSESVSEIYRKKDYHFTSLGVGLVYISPFIGGILGTAVAGRVSDIIVKAMSRRNGGIYEPEFRLVMVVPIAVSTCIGLMGFGWSAEEKDNWIVPTIFFGVISFGSSLGSTTSITFAVDSYRMYAGEGLVTLNFSKNVLHGLVFSLFFNHWLEAEGSKSVFLVIGGIQLACLLTTIPMYVYGKRARMWTYRKNLMEKF
ncbi:MAG: hypothetical protein Q9182_001075 [Xanthomendoza sp. 2 TL-2023]